MGNSPRVLKRHLQPLLLVIISRVIIGEENFAQKQDRIGRDKVIINHFSQAPQVHLAGVAGIFQDWKTLDHAFVGQRNRFFGSHCLKAKNTDKNKKPSLHALRLCKVLDSFKVKLE